MSTVHKKYFIHSLSLAALLTASLNAHSAEDNYVVIAPKCLIKELKNSYIPLSANANYSLVEMNEAGIEEMSKYRHELGATCGGFIDVTYEWSTSSEKRETTVERANSILGKYSTPIKATQAVSGKYSIKYPYHVNALINLLNGQYIWTNLAILSNLHDRYANSDYGVQAVTWMKAQVDMVARSTGRTDISTYLVATGKHYKQPSLVLKIGDSTLPGVVIGAHIDTVSGSKEVKPGADDDGSGSVTILEVARTLMQTAIRFKKPIYVIWYAAEEEGMVGSGYVVRDFMAKNIPVAAAISFDMTGYAYRNDLSFALNTDYADKELTDFVGTLITAYTKQKVYRSTCGFACSDHVSWHEVGVPAAYPFEGDENPYIHTPQDMMNILSLPHMTDFAKLGIGYAVELAEPTA